MRADLRGTLWRLAVFVAVSLLGAFALFAIFAQLRFEPENTYKALFNNVTGLDDGNFVRIAGVEVGKVKRITVRPDALVEVEFSTDRSVGLTEGSRAVIRYSDLVGGRYLALEEGPGGTKVIRPGETLPLANTAPALDLDSLIGGFRPLFRALNPEQVNELSGQLITAFQGQGDAVASFLSHTATVTSTLADRDQLIGEVITNLNTVLGTLGDESGQLDTTVTSLSELIKELADRRTDISAGLANANRASGTFADLLGQTREPLKETLVETDRAATIAVADHDYLDNLIATLPEKYQLLGRQGLYGDFFSFYLCDLFLKVNGKGGQPVYIKVAGQATGRCTPK